MGTLDLQGYDTQKNPASTFNEEDTTLHLSVDTVSVDVEIATAVFPRLKDLEDVSENYFVLF